MTAEPCLWDTAIRSLPLWLQLMSVIHDGSSLIPDLLASVEWEKVEKQIFYFYVTL